MLGRVGGGVRAGLRDRLGGGLRDGLLRIG